jgi:hypothetical protein
MDLEALLPAHLRGPSTTITRIAAGLSGAGVYRVEAGGQVLVLKISVADDPQWPARLEAQQAAAAAGLTPAIVHVDLARRAVLSAFVVDRSFAAWFFDPGSRPVALRELGKTLRRVHGLPLPRGLAPSHPRQLLATIAASLPPGFVLPAFALAALQRIGGETVPPSDRGLVLSHNDVNPSNLVYDGERLLLLDWQTCGASDPLHDLATIAVFLRLDDASCLALLEAHDAAPTTSLPAGFLAARRLVAVLCGLMFLRLAAQAGHGGASGETSLESALGLVEVYQALRAGTLEVASAAGQWAFGLALIKASTSL